jgi:cytidyltransferase-like protein
MIGKQPSLVAGVESARFGHGLVFGKFMPPTEGHIYLADFARRSCDKLTIVVGSLPEEPIPGALRHQWMAEIFPSCTVLHLDKPMPQEPKHPEDLPFFRL